MRVLRGYRLQCLAPCQVMLRVMRGVLMDEVGNENANILIILDDEDDLT